MHRNILEREGGSMNARLNGGPNGEERDGRTNTYKKEAENEILNKLVAR